MTDSYDILRDEAELQRFVDRFVPDLDEDEALVLLLLARSKYFSPEEREAFSLGNPAVLRRETVSSKESLVRRIRTLEVRRGAYVDREGRALPDHVFGVYLSTNPRSHRKAALATLQELADRLYDGQPVRVDAVATSQLHKAASRKVYLDFDVDIGEGDHLDAILDEIQTCLGATPCHVIETRGGAHVVVPTKQLDPAVKKTFYKDIASIGKRMAGEIEVANDAMVPVPGTCHGGVVPRLRAPA